VCAYYNPDVQGQVVTTVITDPAVGADADITLDANEIKFDMREPYPILSIDVIDFLTTGPSFSYTKFLADNYGTAGSLGATEMAVVDEDTFRVGIALNTANHHYILIIKHLAGRVLNTA
jgi:hypothetical protein